MGVFAQTPDKRPWQGFRAGDKNCYYSHFRDLERSSNSEMAPGKSEAQHCTAVSKQRGNPADNLLTAFQLFCHLKLCLFHLCYLEIFSVSVQLIKNFCLSP